MARVKICGNTDTEQVALCADAGADAIGLVVEYPMEVPWNLTREAARSLLSVIPPLISRVVVTGGDPDRVCDLAEALSPHLIQLHTDHPPGEVAQIAHRLSLRSIGLIAALRIDADTGKPRGEFDDPVVAALALQNARVSAILLDATTARLPAGTGKRIDWEMAHRIRDELTVPLILAGGLTPENVRRAVVQVDPFAVDVISGVEASRKVKDPDKVRRFIRQAKAA